MDKKSSLTPAASGGGPFEHVPGPFGEALRNRDWSNSPLGHPDTWAPEFRGVVEFALFTPHPMIAVWGPEHGAIYNEPYAGFLGDRHPAGLGVPVKELWPEAWWGLQPIIAWTYQGHTTAGHDAPFQMVRDGVQVNLWVSYALSPLRGPSGDIEGAAVIVLDMTQEHVALVALREERDQSRNILESMQESCVLLDKEFRILRINAEGLRIDGRAMSRIVGRTLTEVWPSLAGSEMEQALKHAMRDRVPAYVSGRYFAGQGDMWIEGRAYPVGEGLSVFYRDVTAEKKARDELENARTVTAAVTAERAAILGQVIEGVVVADNSGRVTYANSAAEQMTGIRHLGRTPEQYAARGRLKRESGQPFLPEELPLSRAVRKGETVIDEILLAKNSRGQMVAIAANAKPLIDEKGDKVGGVLTIRDETARRRAETALRELNETLETRVFARTAELERAQDALRQAQKMEAVGRLTGGIAHDFNNVLSVVIGSLDLLMRRIEHDPKSHKLAFNAKESAKKASSLTKRLLAFARQQPLAPVSIDPNALVNGMSMLIRRSLGENVSIAMDLDREAWWVLADANGLENAILNLAVNAGDAMPEGGRLLIETRNVVVDMPATVPDAIQGEFVLISVTDNGVGMPEGVIQKAFEPFYTTKEIGKGTGLGLSQVYGFITQSGGHVRITSQVEAGTKVKMYLPKSEIGPVEIGPPRQAPAAKRPTSREWVLVVEDEDEVRDLSMNVFREFGYRTLQASGGRQALEILAQHPEIDLLFTDVAMAGMNGWKLAEEAQRRRPGLKVLFTSGYARNPDIDFRLAEGAVLIEKPFDIETLESKVREVLDRG